MLYPLKFKKVFIEKIWGGRALETELGMNLPENKLIGESWEVSAHKHGMGIISNGGLAGKSLQEVLEDYKGSLVGEKVYNEYKDRFPLLIKYLDINDKLSIQVHPSDEYALAHENELGKCECWFILSASDDAKLILGMKDGVTKEDFLKKAKSNDFTGLFEERAVKKGDFINISPGTVHASLEGQVLLVEVQENSDVTYRIYDFDREENGVKRDLHIDKAGEVINFGQKADVARGALEAGEKRKRLISNKYYTIDNMKLENETFEDVNNESFTIYSILEGKGKLKNGEIITEVEGGESVLIPNGIKIELTGNLEFLRTIV